MASPTGVKSGMMVGNVCLTLILLTVTERFDYQTAVREVGNGGDFSS
jgi:hypothetical protein